MIDDASVIPNGEVPKKNRIVTRVVLATVALSVIAFFVWPVLKGILHHFKGKQPQAQHIAMQLKHSILTYHTEYASFPAKISVNTDAETFASTAEFMSPLLGDWPKSDGSHSPRSIAFFSGRKAEKNWRGKYHSGVRSLPSGGAELLDNWGNHFRIRLDFDGDGKIPNPDSDAPGTFIEAKVIVWSIGRDGKDNAGDGDGVVTW